MSEETKEDLRVTNKENLKKVYDALSAPFPQEALSTDSSRGFDLTSVKAQYITERLNEVLGFNNWRIDGQFDEREDGSVLYQGRLTLFLGDYATLHNGEPMTHYIPTTGFSGKKRLVGDAYKGSRTDALSKAGSYIGIANDVFKGKVAPPSKTKAKVTSINKPSTFQSKTASKISSF